MIKKSRLLITLSDPNWNTGIMEIGPVWNDSDPNRVYVTMRWESKDGPKEKNMALDIEELKNAIRLVEDSEYE